MNIKAYIQTAFERTMELAPNYFENVLNRATGSSFGKEFELNQTTIEKISELPWVEVSNQDTNPACNPESRYFSCTREGFESLLPDVMERIQLLPDADTSSIRIQKSEKGHWELVSSKVEAVPADIIHLITGPAQTDSGESMGGDMVFTWYPGRLTMMLPRDSDEESLTMLVNQGDCTLPYTVKYKSPSAIKVYEANKEPA